jgi:hypothetical protein
MPGFDGTGPRGQGPMTGQRMGFCILKESKDKTGQVEGFAGIQGMPINPYDCKLPNPAAQSMYGRTFGVGFGCGRGFMGGRGRFGR